MKTDKIMNALRIFMIPSLVFWAIWGFALCLLLGAPGLFLGLPVLLSFLILIFLSEEWHIRHSRVAFCFSALMLVLAIWVLVSPLHNMPYILNIGLAGGLIAKPALIWMQTK